jgi:hypothetical protein
MEPFDLLRMLVAALERLGLDYLVTGSMATIAYGEPRLTNDLDVVIALPMEQVEAFCAAFPEEDFYLSPDAVREAVLHRRPFNIIHFASGLKIDVIVPKADDFEKSRQQRGRSLAIGPDWEARFASPEDVILRKLQYYQMGGSDKHLRDIAGVFKIQGSRLDLGYLAEWAERLGVAEIWRELLGRMAEERTQ